MNSTTELRSLLGSEKKRRETAGWRRRILWLGVALALTLPTAASAQTYAVIKSFGVLTNVTGYHPQGNLVQGLDGTLYGATYEGEGPVRGTVFKLNSDGTGFSVLKWLTNSVEGTNPMGGVVLAGSTLYGTTAHGGSSDAGVVFKVNTDGSGYAVLKSFTGGNDGFSPWAGLVVSGPALYGTTRWGGSSDEGAVFRVNTNGTGYTVLKSFTGNDGAEPCADLVLAGSTLYGTTSLGGASGVGVVFKVNTDGSGYTVLWNFPYT